MNELQYKLIKSSEPYLVHYNHNHDKLGRFARSVFGVSFADTVKNGFDIRREKKRRKAEAKATAKNPITKEEIADLEEFERYDGEPSIIKQDLETWNRDAIRDSAFNVNGDPYLHAKREGIQLDMDKVKAEYEKRAAPIRKDLVAPFEISDYKKKPNTKNIDNVKIEDYWSSKTGEIEYRMTGNSKTKKWKEEVRSDKGVHLIETHPTTIEYDDIAHPNGALGISRDRVKALDAFANSKESTKAIYEGRDLVSSTREDTKSQDWSPMHITYGFDSKGKPTIKNATYFNGKLGWDDSDMVDVDFDEKRKPGNPWHT